MILYLLAALLGLPQAPQAGDSPEAMVEQLLKSKDPSTLNTLRDKLRSKGTEAKPAIREALRKEVEGRRRWAPPAELVQRLDGLAVLDLLEQGRDALPAVEEGLAGAEGARKQVLERLREQIREKEERNRFPSFRDDPVTILIIVLVSAKVAEDDAVLIPLLATSPAHQCEAILRQFQSYPLAPESYFSLLAIADARPQTVGRPLWALLRSARVPDGHDWTPQLKNGGPWSRAVAAVRSNDPAILERAFDDRSALIRAALLEVLPTLAMDAEAKKLFVTRILSKLAQDSSPDVRHAVSGTLKQSGLDAPDITLTLLLSDSSGATVERLAYEVAQGKSAPSEPAILRVFELKRSDIIVRLGAILTPARYPNLAGLLAQAHESASAKDRRTIAFFLARWDHEIGRNQIDADLRSSNPQEVISALEEIARHRLVRFTDSAWTLLQHPNSQVAVAARPAAILLGAAAHAADVEKMITADQGTRAQVSRMLNESSGPFDLPLVTVLARSPDHLAQEAAVSALERMNLREVNDALTALRSHKNSMIRHRVDAILGRLEYPSLLASILTDLAALDPRKRSEAQQRYNQTDRTGIRFRIVEGPAAMKDRVVDVPVAMLQSLIADGNPAADDIFNNLTDEPCPASLMDLNTLVRGSPTTMVQKIVKRGKKEDVERLYAQGIRVAEAGPLAQFALEAREIAPEAVDAFLKGWLANPPAGARRDAINRTLTVAATVLPAPQVKELLVSMFRDERLDLSQAAAEVVRTRAALAFPAEAAAAWRDGKVKEKHRLYMLLGAARSAEGEALLREWLKDPFPAVRGQSAAALARLLHADAIPVVGEALFDWFALSKWWVMLELTKGIGPAHQGALKDLLAKASDEQKPLIEALLYAAGSEAMRDRFVRLYPEDEDQRRPFILALENRPGAVDDALMETLIRADRELKVPYLYLPLLVKSDTAKAAEVARFLLETAFRRGNSVNSEYGPACELIARRLPEPPIELLGQVAFLPGTAPNALRALGAIGSEPAVSQIVRVGMEASFTQVRNDAAGALRQAKRYPALLQKVRAHLGVVGSSSNPGSSIALLSYVERDADSMDVLGDLLKRPNVPLPIRLAALQTLLTIPGGDVKAETSARVVPRDPEGSEYLVAEVLRVVVQGGDPKPLPADADPGTRMLMACLTRDRQAAADIIKRWPNSFATFKDLLEIIANRPMSRSQEALQWAKIAGPRPTPDKIASELKALGQDDLRKALRDERPFVRANAAWALHLQQGRKVVSRGPWLAPAPEGGEVIRWLFPGPTPEEIQELEKR